MVALSIGQLKCQGRPFKSRVRQKLSPKNLLGKTLHNILKFKFICSKRQLKTLLMKLFLCAQSFLPNFVFFYCMIPCFSFFFSFIFDISHDHLQSDTIYSPTPGASMDAPDAP